ncbi:MAG: hypothetical protein LBQ22_10720 [Bacteroidales bacterium]|jgi:formate hydrogenlyase subunit 3/multisubunit Na+/H+ antiporter MnhD subunit|nr:hypothetical protein [Bacteroidales bacterium]
MTKAKEDHSGKSKTIGSTILGVFSSILALLGVVSCCGLPILAGILASLGIGASQLSFFAQYRWLFISLAIVSLLFGFYQIYFRKKKNCCSENAEEDSCCSTSAPKKKSNSILFQKIFLWLGAVAIIVILLIGFREGNSSNAPDVNGCCSTEALNQTNSSCCHSEEESVQTDRGDGCCSNQ